MNENIDLTKILKDCPRGTKFYSPVYGWVTFDEVDDSNIDYEEIIIYHNYGRVRLDKFGVVFDFRGNGECIIFPSKDQRDWSKFTAPWYKKEIFDPKTLKPFDRVLVRNDKDCAWRINIYSHKNNNDKSYHDKRYPYVCINGEYSFCIPYNDDTKHLVGTTDEAPDFYKYWED